jgi:hypothetical protein
MLNGIAPIGVFDSGLGGAPVVAAFRQRLADESVVYVADSRFASYGEKSDEFLRARKSRAVGVVGATGCEDAGSSVQYGNNARNLVSPKPIHYFCHRRRARHQTGISDLGFKGHGRVGDSRDTSEVEVNTIGDARHKHEWRLK